MADQQKVVYGLSNGAIFNDLEQPLTQFSRSRYTLTLTMGQLAIAVRITFDRWRNMFEAEVVMEATADMVMLALVRMIFL